MIQILLTSVSKLTVAIYQECLVLFSLKQNYYYLTSTFQESKTLHLPFWVASHLNFRQFYPISGWSLNKQLSTIIKNNSTYHVLGFPDGSVVKNLSAMRNTWFWFWVWFQEDPLEKGMTMHAVFLPGAFWGCKELNKTEWLTHAHHVLDFTLDFPCRHTYISPPSLINLSRHLEDKYLFTYRSEKNFFEDFIITYLGSDN